MMVFFLFFLLFFCVPAFDSSNVSGKFCSGCRRWVDIYNTCVYIPQVHDDL